MNETSHRRWSTLFQVLSLIGIAVGGGLALWQYSDAAKRDFQSPLWHKQVDLYFEAADTAAKLAVLPRGDQWDRAKQRFWELYLGSLILVEDRAVEAAMVQLGSRLKILETNPATKDDDFESLAMRLSHACRDSLNRSLGTNLPTLNGKPASE